MYDYITLLMRLGLLQMLPFVHTIFTDSVVRTPSPMHGNSSTINLLQVCYNTLKQSIKSKLVDTLFVRLCSFIDWII